MPANSQDKIPTTLQGSVVAVKPMVAIGDNHATGGHAEGVLSILGMNIIVTRGVEEISNEADPGTRSRLLRDIRSALVYSRAVKKLLPLRGGCEWDVSQLTEAGEAWDTKGPVA